MGGNNRENPITMLYQTEQIWECTEEDIDYFLEDDLLSWLKEEKQAFSSLAGNSTSAREAQSSVMHNTKIYIAEMDYSGKKT